MKIAGTPKLVRRRCKGCYDFNVGIYGSKVAKNKTSKTNTYCVQCKGYFCLSCFNGIHHGLFESKKPRSSEKKVFIKPLSKLLNKRATRQSNKSNSQQTSNLNSSSMDSGED